MRRRLIVHVGPHKTGTTYIQQRLVADRDLLSTRLGVVYPRTGQDVLFGHHSLVAVFQDTPRHLRELGQLGEELRACKTALLSSERLSKLDPSQLVRLRDHFADFDIWIVAYLRVRSELLVSYWSETVKHGSDRSLPEFLAKTLVAPHSSPIINQTALLDRLSDVFGKSSLQVLIFRPDVDLYAEFLRTILGSDAPSIESLHSGRTAAVNPSLPAYATDCLRLLNYMACVARLDRSLVAAYFLTHHADPALQADLEPFRRMFDERAVSLDLAPIDTTFQQFDQQLLLKYHANVANLTPDGLFPASRVSHVRHLRDLDAVMLDEARDILARIYRTVASQADGRRAGPGHRMLRRFWRAVRTSTGSSRV